MKKGYYTDCNWCFDSIAVDEKTYDYLCNGGQALMLCSDCERESVLAS